LSSLQFKLSKLSARFVRHAHATEFRQAEATITGTIIRHVHSSGATNMIATAI